MKFYPNDTVGNIVTKFPKAVEVFQPLKIDYCCGGHESLHTVCETLHLDEQVIIQELEQLFLSLPKESVDWTITPINQLVDHILQAHHAYLNETLPLLSILTTKILRVHGEGHPELVEIYELFHELKMDMDMHLIKEETKQYPAINKYLQTNKQEDLVRAINIIEELEEDHNHVGTILKKLREITKDYVIPSDVCETFVKTYRLLEELEQNTFAHIHLENNILFPRLKKIG